MQRDDFVPGSVSASDLVAAGWSVPQLLARSPARLCWHPDLDMEAVVALYTRPHTFFNTCQGVRDDASTGYFTATPTQRQVLDFVHQNAWSDIKKGRQGKTSTAIALGVLLRDCQYLEGMQGVLIADTRETAEMLFERIVYAYEREDESVRMPLARGKRPATRHIKFVHGGGVTVLTMGSKAPAVGRSIDRLHISEFGEAQWQEQAATNMFPTVAKRPNAMVILEGTPGLAGSHDEKMWRSALLGRGRFKALFLPWYEEAANRVPGIYGEARDRLLTLSAVMPSGADPGSDADTLAATPFSEMPDDERAVVLDAMLTEEERAYFGSIPGACLLNVLFRRAALDTEFAGDPRLFSAEYPKDPYDGWLGSKHPIMPHDAVKALLARAKPDGAFPVAPGGCFEIHAPEPKAAYLIVGDPAHYGETGDPSALTAWRVQEERMQLVSFWQGREDPGRFAARVAAVQERYSTRLALGEPTTIAIESNAMGCIQALLDAGVDGLFWCERKKPGWFASDQRILRGEGRAVDLLRKGLVEIAAESVLQQIVDYDGSKREKRGRTPDGERHHFDLARTFIIAADVARTLSFVDEGGQDEDAPKRAPDERPGVSWRMYDRWRKAEEDRNRGSPLGPGLYATPQGLYE